MNTTKNAIFKFLKILVLRAAKPLQKDDQMGTSHSMNLGLGIWIWPGSGVVQGGGEGRECVVALEWK